MKHRVLIIDDDPEMVNLGKLILEREGHFEVIRAYSGQEGLEILAADTGIDLILLDIMMVGMNGWDVLEALRSTHHHVHTPVIMLTAHHYFTKERPPKTRGRRNFDDYLLKPFEVSELLDKINDALRYKSALPQSST